MRKSTLPLMAALIALSGCRAAERPAYTPAWKNSSLDQKWNDETSQHVWWTSQGSQVVPYDYVMALEEKDSEELFATNAHFERLRYINQPKSAMNPGGLPIGFVKNEVKVDGLDIMGFSCSACHTARWTINGTDVLVEGGPGKGDMQMFFIHLLDSETQTLEQPDKFDRFAKRVGGAPAKVKASLAKWRDRLAARNARNPIPPEFEGGFGRVDALTAIVNEVTSGDLGIPENARVANASVSYP